MKKQERYQKTKLFLNKDRVAILSSYEMEKIVTGMEDTIARVFAAHAPQSTQDDFNCDYYSLDNEHKTQPQ
ncbi:hypothetical protein ACE38W_07035 [Chitinophaga sp. Hz27]|uniref:hypothetical protein n=1 Tax=Chitinophaga sp. Hz27 TaxID=3347169 RepID=UPI0035DAAA30